MFRMPKTLSNIYRSHSVGKQEPLGVQRIGKRRSNVVIGIGKRR